MCTAIVLFKVLDYKENIKVSDNESKDLQFFPMDNLPPLELRAEKIIKKILNEEIKVI